PVARDFSRSVYLYLFGTPRANLVNPHLIRLLQRRPAHSLHHLLHIHLRERTLEHTLLNSRSKIQQQIGHPVAHRVSADVVPYPPHHLSPPHAAGRPPRPAAANPSGDPIAEALRPATPGPGLLPRRGPCRQWRYPSSSARIPAPPCADPAPKD